METEPQVDARARIEKWIVWAENAQALIDSYGGWAKTVRAALAAYDEDHHRYELPMSAGGRWRCSCNHGAVMPKDWLCPTKSRHEAALWKAISGEGA